MKPSTIGVKRPRKESEKHGVKRQRVLTQELFDSSGCNNEDGAGADKKAATKRISTKLSGESVSRMGMIRVAKYYPGKPVPKTEGYVNILIHTKGTNLGGDLSPYILKDENGRLLENIWQFSKVYPVVFAQRTPISRFHPRRIIWEHPREVHYENDKILPAYWKWRRKGMANEHAVRYPNGFHGRHKCLFSLWPGDSGHLEQMGYIEARKKIYCGEYARLAIHTPHFSKLKSMLLKGTNLQIIEVDGPNPSLQYEPFDQISEDNPGLLITEDVIRLLINDARQPFGHGYVIATLLLGESEWLK